MSVKVLHMSQTRPSAPSLEFSLTSPNPVIANKGDCADLALLSFVVLLPEKICSKVLMFFNPARLF